VLQIPAWRSDLRGEVLGRDRLPMLLPAWRDLCDRAVEDNVYYSPRYAQALLRTIARYTDVRFAVVWSGARLIALFPFTRRWLSGPFVARGNAWQTEYTFSCTPLLDKAQKDEAADALLDLLASAATGEWLLPTVNTRGEACQAIIAALARKQMPWRYLRTFERACLEGSATFEEYVTHHISSKRRRDLARNRRRLEELGKVEHQTYRFGNDLACAVEAFLGIEASGWKGTCGGALACRESGISFAIEAFTGDESSSICRADVLRLNDVPIAVGLIVFAGQTGFTVKCCYDEKYRSYSAGLLLELEVIRSFFAERWAERLDSGTAGAHVIDGLWSGRIEVADLIFSLAPRGANLRLAALQGANRATNTIWNGLRHLRTRLKSS
jgi:CelD/BcsL family acetyltransferase involved in cellulose biosynthesis